MFCLSRNVRYLLFWVDEKKRRGKLIEIKQRGVVSFKFVCFYSYYLFQTDDKNQQYSYLKHKES